MKSLVLLLLLAAQARAGIISGGSAGGSSSSGGISTGAVTTAALTGNGQITSPLGVNSSSVAVYDANRNLTVPYGVAAATGAFTGHVGVSSLTANITTNGLGISVINTGVAPAIKLRTTAGSTNRDWAIVTNYSSAANLEFMVGANAGDDPYGGPPVLTLNGLSPRRAGILAGNPASTFDVNGNMSVGTYATVNAAPANGMIVSGNVGIGTVSPATTIDVNGNAQFGQIKKATFTVSGGLELPYGVIAATAVITYVQASSATLTDGATIYGALTVKGVPVIRMQNATGVGAKIEMTSGAQLSEINFDDADYNLEIINGANIAVDDGIYNGIRFYNGGDRTTPKMLLSRQGRLGIGTGVMAPATKLHVSSGVLTLDGTGAGLRFAGGTTQSSTTYSHVSGALTANLTAGVTFFSFVSDSAISMRRITTTIQVASVGAGNDVIYCNNAAGTGVSVTSAVGAAAGTSTTAVGSADIAYQGQVFCHYEGGATTKPNLSFALGYVHQ